MAVVLAWRIAVALAPAGGAASVRVLRWAEGPGVATGTRIWNRVLDPGESDEDLSLALSESTGSLVEVATYDGSFETRRLQANWRVTTTGLLDEDVRVCTFHLLKVSGGSPVASWDAADFTAAKNAFLAFWTTMKTYYASSTILDSLKFYREGPGIEPPQPPVHAQEGIAVAGTAGSNDFLPPQVAVSVTEKTAIRKSWGRFYLPAMSVQKSGSPTFSTVGPTGRIPDAMCNHIADTADTMYEAWRTASLIPVVYRRELPAREEVDGDELPPRAASALSVDQLQVDNLYDVIRSRRYDKPSLRVQRAIG